MKVLITDYVWSSIEVEKSILDGVADVAAMNATSAEDFVEAAADCDALLNTYAGPITAEVIRRLPKCKIIARYGIGVDTIDVEAATAAGIIVTNNPSYCIDEVAEHAIALILSSWRKIVLYDRNVSNGAWDVPSVGAIRRLRGATLGLVGFGQIAKQVALRAAGLGLNILFADPVAEEDPSIPAAKVSFDKLLSDSDIVSLHLPLNPATRGLMGAEQFAAMKRDAILVNVARGPIVETGALIRALDDQAIAGCALDTTDPEPLPADHRLNQRDNVIITPHAAWYSKEALLGLQSGAPQEVRSVLTGKWPNNIVNPLVKNNNRANLL